MMTEMKEAATVILGNQKEAGRVVKAETVHGEANVPDMKTMISAEDVVKDADGLEILKDTPKLQSVDGKVAAAVVIAIMTTMMITMMIITIQDGAVVLA